MAKLASQPPATHAVDAEIRYVFHPDFKDRGQQQAWSIDPHLWSDASVEKGYMPDDMTRAHVRHMHYAAHRVHSARSHEDREKWRSRYFAWRDQVVLGNRKLVYGAVRKKLYQNQAADDLVGECYIVMIRAVAAYNPWLGIRFSTYAYTCLMRALSRLNQRSVADKLAQHLSLDLVESDALGEVFEMEGENLERPKLKEYLDERHPLLTPREKTVLRRRFRIGGKPESNTLEKVGADLGISKERVRQVQAGAIDKLRRAFSEE